MLFIGYTINLFVFFFLTISPVFIADLVRFIYEKKRGSYVIYDKSLAIMIKSKIILITITVFSIVIALIITVLHKIYNWEAQVSFEIRIDIPIFITLFLYVMYITIRNVIKNEQNYKKSG